MSSMQSAGGSLQAIGIDDERIVCGYSLRMAGRTQVCSVSVDERMPVMVGLAECSIYGAQGLLERTAVHACKRVLERRQRRVMSRFIREDGSSAGQASESQEVVR